MPEKSSKQTSPRKQETRLRCKYCKNFGHTVDDCRTVRKKRDEDAAASSKKNRDETVADETSSGNRRTQPVVTCFGCGNPGYLRKDCPKCNKKEKADKSEVRSEFCLVDASVDEIQAKYKNRPILDVEILGAKGTGLIDTAAKLSVAGHSLYKILVEKGQKFKKSNLRIGLADES
ncbi:dna rna polymerases superfamily protein [Lasius niger]|uniref:Dna rna polymerases superfamily protein n=1 Tax=Lasius niger TaxID=67767 RepID=A0A0J7N9M3_LASNI|nr:dna rna polymerases superfamily protein [Lasius niger]